jgi:addiction module HigA family antidote
MHQLLEPVHPGEILAEEFLQPFGITQYRLAKDTAVPPRRINEIVQGQRAITADTALRLARFFGTSEMFWLNLQARYDLDVQKAKLGSRLASVRPFVKATQPRPHAAPKSGAVRSAYRRKAR